MGRARDRACKGWGVPRAVRVIAKAAPPDPTSYQGASHANSRRLRTDLRLPATDPDAADAEHPSFARGRHRRSRPLDDGPGRAGPRLSRCVRQLVQPDRGATRENPYLGHRRCQRLRPARSGRHRCPPAPGTGPARRRPGFSARQPLLRDRSSVGDRVAPVRTFADRLGPRAGDLRFRAPSYHVRLHESPPHQDGVGCVQRTPRRLPRFRASGRWRFAGA